METEAVKINFNQKIYIYIITNKPIDVLWNNQTRNRYALRLLSV